MRGPDVSVSGFLVKMPGQCPGTVRTTPRATQQRAVRAQPRAPTGAMGDQLTVSWGRVETPTCSARSGWAAATATAGPASVPAVRRERQQFQNRAMACKATTPSCGDSSGGGGCGRRTGGRAGWTGGRAGWAGRVVTVCALRHSVRAMACNVDTSVADHSRAGLGVLPYPPRCSIWCSAQPPR